MVTKYHFLELLLAVNKVFQFFQGSLGFFFDGILVTGDTVYRTDHELIDWYPGSSSIDMASSVKKILNMSHEVNLALPGRVRSSLSLITYLESKYFSIRLANMATLSSQFIRPSALAGIGAEKAKKTVTVIWSDMLI